MKGRHSIRFLLITSLLISVSIIIVLLYLTVGQKTWEALRQVHFKYIFLSFLFALLANCLDSARIQILCRAFGYHLPFWEGLKAIFAYQFLANITPSAMGGEPVLIYLLTEKTGMDSQKATTISIVRGALLISIIAVAGPVILLFNRDYLKVSFIRDLFDYMTIFLIIIVGILVYSFFNARKVRQLLEKGIGFFQRYSLFQKHPTPQLWVRHIWEWIEDFINSLKYLFKEKKLILFYTGCFTIFSMLLNYSIVYILIKGLGHEVHFLKVLAIQLVLYFILYLTPTPGGSGFAEGGFYLLFYNFVPMHLIGILLLLWRFFIAYLWVFVGWVVIVKKLGFKGVEEIKGKVSLAENV